MNRTLPPTVLFGIDTETDVGSFTPFYEGVRIGVPRLLELFDKHNVETTFFVTGDAAVQNRGACKLIASAGHEVGCHSLYHETVGDELFPIPGVKPLLPEEVPLRLRTATEWVAAELGESPVSFRSPRLWGSTAVINTLEELGYLVDSSYPMYFYRQQFAPYHPDRVDWTRRGDSRVLEIPLFADMTMASKDPGLERDRDQWPLFRTKGADHLLSRTVTFLDFLCERNLPQVLCFYFHPWEFIEVKESYHYGEGTVIPDPFIVQNCGLPALRELDKLIGALKGIGAIFMRYDNFARQYDDLTEEG